MLALAPHHVHYNPSCQVPRPEDLQHHDLCPQPDAVERTRRTDGIKLHIAHTLHITTCAIVELKKRLKKFDDYFM